MFMEPWRADDGPLMVWLIVMMEMEPVWCGGAQMMEMEFVWWWCSLEMPWWCLMSSQSSLMHVVGSHAIWCLGAMGLAHDGGVMVAWWVSAMLMMTWYIHVIDVMLWWAYEPWWVLAMPWLFMRIPYPFLNPSSPLHTSKPFLAPYTTPSPFLYPSAIHYLA